MIELRKDILGMLALAGSGHPGGSLSAVDIMYVLYKDIMVHDSKNPVLKKRDRFVLSAGHLAPALYAVLAKNGYFSRSKLSTLRKFNSDLQGHPERGRLPGIENTSGPLGQGYANAVGKALALKKQKSTSLVYCLASDGEHDEGVVWESAQIAAHQKLSNLCVIIDRNDVQIDGRTKDISDLRSLKQKYKSFGWKVIEIDGHNLHMIKDALKYFLLQKQEQPFCIVAHTKIGKGVSFMEDNPDWHGKVPSADELSLALKELDIKKHQRRMARKLIERKVFL